MSPVLGVGNSGHIIGVADNNYENVGERFRCRSCIDKKIDFNMAVSFSHVSFRDTSELPNLTELYHNEYKTKYSEREFPKPSETNHFQ